MFIREKGLKLKKHLFFYLLFYTIILPAEPASTPDPNAEKLFLAALEMRVQIYRISRDKIYEIYYPDFESLQPDLAEAINVLEEKISEVEHFSEEVQGVAQLRQAVSVWNNLRFHALRKLEKKDIVRFYYDTQTFDNFLKILMEKLKEAYAFNEKKWTELEKRYLLQVAVFKVNIGYMAKHYDFSKSMEHIMVNGIRTVEETFQYAKSEGYFSGDKLTDLLVPVLNDWLFLKYNLNNVLFKTDLVVYSVTNSLFKRIGMINKHFENEN